jgi:hypothetical protein
MGNGRVIQQAERDYDGISRSFQRLSLPEKHTVYTAGGDQGECRKVLYRVIRGMYPGKPVITAMKDIWDYYPEDREGFETDPVPEKIR